MLFTFLGSIGAAVLKIFPQMAEIVGNVIVKKAESEAVRQGNENENGKLVTLGWLQSVIETNRIKAEHQTERQMVFALIAFATPVGILFWGSCLDSMPFRIPYFMAYPHIIGSWGVTIPPGFADEIKMIIQSFFIAAPVVAGASILAKAFRR